MFKNVVILAAGRGNRMRPLTDIVPKALAPYKGSTLIEHSISALSSDGLNIHVTVGHLGGHLAERLFRKDLIQTALSTAGHGNSWWIYKTLLSRLDEPVLVLTCDNITELRLIDLYNQYLSLGQPHCMLVPVKPLDGVEGDYLHCSNSQINKISRGEISEMYASGIQILNPRKICTDTTFSDDFGELWGKLILMRQLCASEIYPYSWFSIDSLEQLAERNSAD